MLTWIQEIGAWSFYSVFEKIGHTKELNTESWV